MSGEDSTVSSSLSQRSKYTFTTPPDHLAFATGDIDAVLTDRELRCYMAIMKHAWNPGEVAMPGQDRLATLTGSHSRTIPRLIESLWRKGAIDVDHRSNGKRMRYRLLVEIDDINARIALRTDAPYGHETTFDSYTPEYVEVTRDAFEVTEHAVVLHDGLLQTDQSPIKVNNTISNENRNINARTRATPPQRSAPRTSTTRTATNAVVEAQRERVDAFHRAKGEEPSLVSESTRKGESQYFAGCVMPVEDIAPLVAYVLTEPWYAEDRGRVTVKKLVDLWVTWVAAGKPERKVQVARGGRQTPEDIAAMVRNAEAAIARDRATDPQPTSGMQFTPDVMERLRESGFFYGPATAQLSGGHD